MLRDDTAVLDIVLACRSILEFTTDVDQNAFAEDRKTQSAVLHQLMIIGEAVNRLSDSFCDRHSKIPWPQIAGMRNRLIHEYDHVDLDEVWRTVRHDISELLAYLEAISPGDAPD